MARMFKAKRAILRGLGIFDLKGDRSAFKVDLGEQHADVVFNHQMSPYSEYNVLGIKIPKDYEGVAKIENQEKIKEAIDYVAYISRIKEYSIRMLL